MADSNKRNIPIKLDDFNVIDNEFSSNRERFDSEMRKTEEKMAKFRHELINCEGNFFESTSQALSSRPKQNYISDINSPLIQEDDDNKVFKLRLDVRQYAPEEIVAKTDDQKLLVHAKHEEKSDIRSVCREYNREFLLPKSVSPESSLSKDGDY